MTLDHPDLALMQLSRLDPYLWGIRRDLVEVLRTPTLRRLRILAEERSALPVNQGMVEDLKESGVWWSLGKLKQALTKDLCNERDAYLGEVLAGVREPEMGAMQ